MYATRRFTLPRPRGINGPKKKRPTKKKMHFKTVKKKTKKGKHENALPMTSQLHREIRAAISK